MISIKNSRDAIQHLLSVSDSTHLIVDEEFKSYAESLELPIPSVTFEDIAKVEDGSEIFDLGNITQERRAMERELPAFYFHTSGSTGHPKIIAYVRTHLTLS